MGIIMPQFPKEPEMISSTLEVFEYDDIVNYMQNGMPIACHIFNDLKSFRYYTALFVTNGLCQVSDIVRFFGVSEDSVRKSIKILEEKGEKGFFGKRKIWQIYPVML